ncbi:MAG: hypothetical protein V7K85_12635 [Nostoc sp.]
MELVAKRAESKADIAGRRVGEVDVAERKDRKDIAEFKKGIDQLNGKAEKALQVALTALALYQTFKALRGIPGLQGVPGTSGATGRQDTPGRDGLNGRDGVTSIIQVPGTPGRQGDRGLPGLSGLAGRPGRDGINGQPGAAGAPGRNGTNGRNGLNGLNGRDGVDVNPGDLAGLREFIRNQHAQTRASGAALHNITRTYILTPIMAILAPVLILCQKIFDIVSKAADVAQLALLNIINNKLGKQVTGGLSGFIEQIAKNTYIEKVLSVLTFAATVHNALMLSNNLGQTLGGVINQVLAFILPKGIDGTPLDINEIIKKSVEEILETAIGEDNYKTISQDWALANRIYQAGSNVFNQISNAMSVATAALELIGGNIGKIGNALKIWGVIGEKAYGFMNPQPNLKGKFFHFMENANTDLNTIAMVVAAPIAMVEAANGVNSAITDLTKTLDQEDPKDKNGNPIVDRLGNVIKYQPGITVPEPIVTVKGYAQAKADSTNSPKITSDDTHNASD